MMYQENFAKRHKKRGCPLLEGNGEEGPAKRRTSREVGSGKASILL